MKNYKIYAENHPALLNRDDDQYLSRIDLKSILNPSGKILLTIDDLFEMDPRSALIIYLLADMQAISFEHPDVLVDMQEAFDDVIDFIHGGLTMVGYDRYAGNCHSVGCTAATHRRWVQYERAKGDPVAMAALPKGTIANLGGHREPNITRNN